MSGVSAMATSSLAQPASAEPAEISSTLAERLVPPMPAGGWRGWAGPVLVTLIAAVLRLVDLGRPNAIAFDETYYVKDGLSLLLFGYERGSVDGADKIILDTGGGAPG